MRLVLVLDCCGQCGKGWDHDCLGAHAGQADSAPCGCGRQGTPTLVLLRLDCNIVVMVSSRSCGESSAALNWALARKSAGLTEAVQSVCALASPLKGNLKPDEHQRNLLPAVPGRLAARPFASTSVVCVSPVWSVPVQRLRGFFHGFFSPPQCIQLAGNSSARWQLRLVSKLAGVVMLRNGEWSKDTAVMQDPTAPRLDEYQVRTMFDEMDVNGDGFIDRDELLHWLSAVGLPASNSCYLGCELRSVLLVSFIDCVLRSMLSHACEPPRWSAPGTMCGPTERLACLPVRYRPARDAVCLVRIVASVTCSLMWPLSPCYLLRGCPLASPSLRFTPTSSHAVRNTQTAPTWRN